MTNPVGHSSLLVVDIAHPPLAAAQADAVLAGALRNVRVSTGMRILMIVHGYGSSGTGGVLKQVARNFAFRNRSRVRRIIECERLSLSDPGVEEMLKECGVTLSELSPGNDGATVIWVR